MKKNHIILIIVLLGFLAWIFFGQGQSTEEQIAQFEENIVQENNGQMCFLYEAAVAPELAGDVTDAFNREYLELTIAVDGNVAGSHNIIPYGTDSNFANFIGVTDGEFVNVIATATAEGDTWQEQRLYKIEEDRILVGYQPVYVPRYQNENGIFLYEDINQIEFATNEFSLEKVACNSVDKDTIL